MLTLQRMMACLSVSLPATMIQLMDGICFHKMGSQIIYAGTLKYRMTKVYHFTWGKQNHFLHRKIHPLHKWRSAHSMIFFTQFLHCRGIITMDNMEHQLKFRLSVRNTSDTCLDASAGQRRTASEIRFPMFSACRWHAKQVIRSLPSPPDHQPNLLNSEDYWTQL